MAPMDTVHLLLHVEAPREAGPGVGGAGWQGLFPVSWRVVYGGGREGCQQELGLRLRQGDQRALCSGRWCDWVAGWKRSWVRGTAGSWEASRALNSPAQSARPTPGPRGSVPTCPGGGRGWGVRSQRREGMLGPAKD